MKWEEINHGRRRTHGRGKKGGWNGAVRDEEASPPSPSLALPSDGGVEGIWARGLDWLHGRGCAPGSRSGMFPAGESGRSWFDFFWGGWLGLLFLVGWVEWVVGVGVDVVGNFFDHALHGDGFIFWWNLWNIRGF